MYRRYILNCEGKVLIRSLKSKQILTIANIGIKYRVGYSYLACQGAIADIQLVEGPFSAALLFKQNQGLLDVISQ